jgi:ABC-type bacteriocin/lantibiotic exporter with double-glycine peptidase domain
MSRRIAPRKFLALYPASVTRAIRVGFVFLAAASLLDFASMLLLFPVFTNLTSGSSTPVSTPLSDLLDLSVQAYIVLAMACMIVRSVANYAIRSWWMKRVAHADVSLSGRLISAYVYAPYEFHLQSNSAELMSRAVSNVNTATFGGLGGILTLATDGTTIAALAAALLVASPLPGLVVCLYLAVVGGAFAYVSRHATARYSRQYTREVSHVYQRTATVLRGVRELTVANAQPQVLRSIGDARTAMTAAQRRLALLTDIPRLTLETALYAAVLIALLIVAGRSDPSRALPVVALYVVAGLRVLPAVSRALGTMTQIRSGTEIAGQIADELQSFEQQGTARTPGAGEFAHAGELRLTNVSFGYGKGDDVLTGVDLRIPYGRFVAIVGPSGGGKSTLLGLMLGLLRPSSGTIEFGSHEIGVANPAWLARVGYVPQESYMLDDSVLANIVLGNDTVDVERAWEALRRAGLERHVRQLADGLNTLIGENGSRLSVGQRQRLGLARALYRSPSVLLLDEPTAALDALTEQHVVGTIESLVGEVTIVMVTHRPEPIRGADIVYSLREGVLDRQLVGSQEEL